MSVQSEKIILVKKFYEFLHLFFSYVNYGYHAPLNVYCRDYNSVFDGIDFNINIKLF